MITEKEIIVKEKAISTAKCDKCGKEVLNEADHPGDMAGVDFTIDFGYCSSRDGSRIRIQLCNDCLEEFLSSLDQYDESEYF